MYFVYIDESGDPGYITRDRSITEAYTLSALILRDDNWTNGLNDLISFRKYLKNRYGLKMSDELKASYLIHNTGPFSTLGLSDESRMKIFRKSLQFQSRLGYYKTWSIVIDKARWEAKGYKLEVLEGAWKTMIERLERFTNSRNEPCIIFPDEGNERIVTGALRRLRRFGRPNSKYGRLPLIRDAQLILEDPNFRKSHASYFIQLADLNAYAATRSTFPKSWFGKKYWEYLGDSRDTNVNALAGGTRGISLKP